MGKRKKTTDNAQECIGRKKKTHAMVKNNDLLSDRKWKHHNVFFFIPVELGRAFSRMVGVLTSIQQNNRECWKDSTRKTVVE